MADTVGVRWRSELYGWLPLGWTAAGNEEEPIALELQDGGGTAIFTKQSCAEDARPSPPTYVRHGAHKELE